MTGCSVLMNCSAVDMILWKVCGGWWGVERKKEDGGGNQLRTIGQFEMRNSINLDGPSSFAVQEWQPYHRKGPLCPVKSGRCDGEGKGKQIRKSHVTLDAMDDKPPSRDFWSRLWNGWIFSPVSGWNFFSLVSTPRLSSLSFETVGISSSSLLPGRILTLPELASQINIKDEQ